MVFKDLTNKKFGRLTVIKRTPNKKNRAMWYCNCDCGNSNIIVCGSNLISGNTQSCGCLHKQRTIEHYLKKNTYDVSGEYGIGYLFNNDEPFYFDLDDYNKIKDCCWLDSGGYIKNSNGINMHRFILNCYSDCFVDHINHNKHDNRKCNLRIVTKSQNAMNQKVKINNTSGVTGVSFDKKQNKWCAYIKVNYKKKHLGYFENFDDAVKSRKEAEDKYFGEYGYLNSLKLASNN